MPGIAQVVPIGGEVKQVEVVLAPDRLMQHRIGAAQVLDALEAMSESTPGGFYVAGQEEYLIRGVGRLGSLEALGARSVGERDGVPIAARGRRRRSLRRQRSGAARRRSTASTAWC